MPKKKVKTSSTKKRKPSEYNKFVKKEMNAGKSMEEAAHAWTKHKATLPSKTKSKALPKTKIKASSSLESALVQNLIELQKIHIDLAEKFDRLSKEISNILALFEVTARNFAKNVPMGEFEKDKDFLDKIDRLLDQNKTLAKGLMLMEERLRERVYGASDHNTKAPEELRSSIAGKRPLPRF